MFHHNPCSPDSSAAISGSIPGAGKLAAILRHDRQKKVELEAEKLKLANLRARLRDELQPHKRRALQVEADALSFELEHKKKQLAESAAYYDRRFGITL
jgi:hypothetical protein